MRVPSCDDKVTLDANSLIQYSLDLGVINQTRVASLYTSGVRVFLTHCKTKNVQVGYFRFILEEAYRNIVSAVNRLASQRKVGSHYKRSKLVGKGKRNLDVLVKRISHFNATWTGEEVEEVRQFYKDNEVDVQKALNLQRPKRNIPEDNDLRLFVCTNNLDCPVGYIMSEDAHFLAYEDVIHKSQYNVRILSTKDCNLNMIAWGWMQ